MGEFELTPEIFEQFKTESRENIKHAEAALLLLEKSTEASEAIHELFRSIHTIKGSADYLGLKDLKELSHAFENVLDRLRKLNSTSISAEQSDVFFDVLDVLANLIASAPETSEQYSWHSKQLIEQLTRINLPKSSLNGEEIKVIDSPNDQVTNDDKSIKIFRDTIGQQCDVLIRAKIKLQTEGQKGGPIDPGVRGMVSRALQCIKNASQYQGEEELDIISSELQNWVLSPIESKDSQEFILKVENYLPKVQEVSGKISKRREKLIEGLVLIGNKETSEHLPISNTMELNKLMESKTVRVDQDVLDGFMNLVGELIVARNVFSHIQTKLLGTEEDRMIALKEFRESSNRLTHITGELQRNVMEMRMLPIKTLFQRYTRIVRDVCRKTGKVVEVIFEGEDTEIDKGIADQISEPLIHVVRNAVDHGIESAEERKKAGKSESGTLIMKASHQGNFIVIEVTDDGGGINIERIKSKIIEKGLLTLDQVSRTSKSELLDYIFTPGFSTAVAITDISGRGVGLDVVKTNLKKIKGSVSVSSEMNQGTCFRLEVPLTMAIMRALLVKSGQSIYAISLQDVNETVKIRYDELKSIRQKMAISLRGDVVMVDWLGQLLGHSDRPNILPELQLSVLILQVNGNKFGLIVDSVFRQEEIVVKPLPESYAVVPGLAGASILGDGKAILILDSNQLYGLRMEVVQ